MGRAPEKKRGDGRKENAGRSISRDIVRLIEEMTTPWDQKSIPRMLCAGDSVYAGCPTV